ncbi:unnamed protein product [Phytomonas sp. EM1]|nr:unnamed protein product [Phytomonas sp. EM1]|eukprot:CCW62684.1 unnamed protein product [Phytomonas sp. isolate EM1]
MVSRVQSKLLTKNSRKKHNSNSISSSSKARFSDDGMPTKTLIPSELDEEIDDDLAFDSDDERLYGHFFQHQEKGNRLKSKKNVGKKGKSSKGIDHLDDDEDNFMEEQFGALERAEGRTKKSKGGSRVTDEEDLYNYHEDGQSSDGSDYMDLSDMLDANLSEMKEEVGKKKKSSKKKTKTIAEDGERQIVKKQRVSKLTEEKEAFFGSAIAAEDGVAQSYSAAIQQFINSEGSSKEEEIARNRLEEAFRNKHNLLAVDLEDSEKERFVRKEVRSIVDENLSKYKPLLQELNKSKHLQLPMRAPESNPTPSSLGGIVAASEVLFSERAPEASNPAQKLTSRMNEILSRAGISRRQLEEVHSHVSTSDSIGNYVSFSNSGDNEIEGEDSVSPGESSSNAKPPSVGYMAKLKAMLAYENTRRKRFNRIKSKAYRRILRKEKDREKERRQKAFELLHPEQARKKLAEVLARSRAEERVTQKHKNTSAWVKHAKRFAHIDVNVKDALSEQNMLRQKLMQKMDEEVGKDNYDRYVAGADGDDGEMSSEEERVVDELFAQMTADSQYSTRKTEPLTSILWKNVEDDGDEEVHSPITRARAELREMKFMKNAREREEKAYAAELAALQEDIQQYQSTTNGKDDTSDEGDDKVNKRIRSAPNHASDNKVTGPTSLAGASQTFPDSSNSKHRVEVINLRKQPGLQATEVESEAQPLSDVSLSETKESKMIGNNLHSSHKEGVVAAEDGFAGERKKMPRPTRITIKPEPLKKRVRPVQEDATHLEGGEPVTADSDAAEELPSVPKEDLRLHQEYLVSRAFAHDEIDEDFLKEKTAQVETIMKPEDVNENLPGWGEWGGTDPKLNKRHQEKLEHSMVQRQIEKSFLMKSRADAALDHVIINHDGVELVPDRMTLHMVPRPFSNAQEFARFMRQPLGPEWSSALSFKEGVQPRIEVRQGQSVLPLDLSLRRKANKTKRRKIEKKENKSND